jgi:hypothetical protein
MTAITVVVCVLLLLTPGVSGSTKAWGIAFLVAAGLVTCVVGEVKSWTLRDSDRTGRRGRDSTGVDEADDHSPLSQ